jgi:hypothetical protein
MYILTWSTVEIFFIKFFYRVKRDCGGIVLQIFLRNRDLATIT